MAVKYKLYQDNRKESKNKGMWYARAIVSGMLDLQVPRNVDMVMYLRQRMGE